MLDDDKRKLYCYHGGKCKCDNCELVRMQMQEELDKNFEEFVKHDRLNLKPTIRHAKRKQYRLEAFRVSPEMGEMLIKHHLQLLKDYPIYYLDKGYYKPKVYKHRGPKHVATQTEYVIGNYGIDGCPCPNKSVCWDL